MGRVTARLPHAAPHQLLNLQLGAGAGWPDSGCCAGGSAGVGGGGSAAAAGAAGLVLPPAARQAVGHGVVRHRAAGAFCDLRAARPAALQHPEAALLLRIEAGRTRDRQQQQRSQQQGRAAAAAEPPALAARRRRRRRRGPEGWDAPAPAAAAALLVIRGRGAWGRHFDLEGRPRLGGKPGEHSEGGQALALDRRQVGDWPRLAGPLVTSS